MGALAQSPVYESDSSDFTSPWDRALAPRKVPRPEESSRRPHDQVPPTPGTTVSLQHRNSRGTLRRQVLGLLDGSLQGSF